MSTKESLMLTFQEVEFGSDAYKKLVNIRYEVLRKPLGMDMRPKDVTTDAHEYHLAAYDGEKPIACALLRPVDMDAVQLRQVAVLDDYQGKRVGTKLVTFAEDFARGRGFTSIAARARKDALKFYDNLGYSQRPHEFEDEHTLKVIKEL